ncbi:MAG: glycosyl hydrolase [Gammaproteobacteria bacterium]|nr:glycosyl hydrolase [Gammaproteobacteria bacterium]NND60946.1 glycosyl hydrolase [Gammaproteobacteria bacterium]
MSKPNPYQRRLSLLRTDAQRLPDDELGAAFRRRLEAGIHGLSFSPYSEGQEPGTEIDAGQIRDRLSIIAPYVSWIRSFSCTEGNELIPAIAHEMGLKTLVGAWIGDDPEKNELEMNGLIELAGQGHVDIMAVGNEVLLREEQSDDELIGYIERARSAVPNVPVGYVDAYFLFVDHPRVTEACDVLLANCYPFWEGCPADYATLYMKDMFRRVRNVAGGKKIIVSETGWPDKGTAFGAAEPSTANAIRYFLNTYDWADEDDIEIFYFAAFDEDWKVGAEGDVGAYWGLWDKYGELKYG